MKRWSFLIPLTTLFLALGGRLLSRKQMDWYSTIKLPSYTPPRFVFPIVWNIIFILTTISALIVWNSFERTKQFWIIITLFSVNAFLNIFWTFLFFNQHMIGASVIDAALLTITIYLLIALIWPQSKLAAILLFPYAGWCTFATIMNFHIWLIH